MGAALLRELSTRNGIGTLGGHPTDGGPTGTEEEPQSLRGKHGGRPEEGKAGSELDRPRAPLPGTPGRGWVQRRGLQGSVPGGGLGLALRKQPEGPGSSAPEPSCHGKRPGPAEARCHCWGGKRRGRQDRQGNFFLCACTGSQAAGVAANCCSHFGLQKWTPPATTEGPATRHHLQPDLKGRRHRGPCSRARPIALIFLGMPSPCCCCCQEPRVCPHLPVGCPPCQGPRDQAPPVGATHHPTSLETHASQTPAHL